MIMYASCRIILAIYLLQKCNLCTATGKSFSEDFILESINPQYDERLFIEFQEKYKFTTCCVQN